MAQGFDAEELARLSASIDPLSPPAHTDYYPLPAATSGERFPQAHTYLDTYLDSTKTVLSK